MRPLQHSLKRTRPLQRSKQNKKGQKI